MQYEKFSNAAILFYAFLGTAYTVVFHYESHGQCLPNCVAVIKILPVIPSVYCMILSTCLQKLLEATFRLHAVLL